MNKKIKPYETLNHAVKLTSELVEKIVTDNEMLVLRAFLKNIHSVLNRSIRNAEDGMPVLGYNFSIPPEIFYAFDCVPFCFESTPFILSSLLPNGAEYFYDVANYHGHPFHTCSAQKGIIGMVLDEVLDFDAIITPTAPCDNALSYEWFSEYRNIPLVLMDLPYYRRDEQALEYYAGELWRAIDELGKILDQKPDFKKLKQAVDNSRKAQEGLLEVHEMRKTKPCPIESMANPIVAAATTLMPCTPEKIQFFDDLKAIGKKRIKNGQGRPGFERFRSIWPYMSIFYDMSMYDWLDREIGMTQLFDIFNYYFYDPIYIDNKSTDEIMLGLARQGISFPMIRQSAATLQSLIDDFIWISKEYQADTAVITEHLGCKQMAGVTQLLKEAMRDELGIPTIVIELDVGDKRMTPMDSIFSHLREFAKTMG